MKTKFKFKTILLIIFFFTIDVNSQVNPDHADYSHKDSTGLEPITINSHGSKLQGYFCRAKGDGPHPTIIFLHGAPGGPKDVFGLAENAPRAGWNALVFTYRGYYKSEGKAFLKNSLEDVFSALKFLRSSDIAKKYNIDVNHIALAGYSYGGDMALTAAASDSSIKYTISIAAADISEIAREAEQNSDFSAMFIEMIDNRNLKGFVKGLSGKESLDELLADSDKYDLVKHAKNLSKKSLLIIGGWKDQASTLEEHVLPLIRALQSHGAEHIQYVILDDNHAFKDKRVELVDTILSWLREHHPQKEKRNHEAKIRELHRKHMEASINHDIETLRALFHEDIIWYLGHDTLKGKSAAIVPHEYDTGQKTTLKYSNVIVTGDTVRFDLLETNEQVQFFGMEAIRLYPQFIFKDGLVYRKMPWKRSGDMSKLFRRSQPFRNWVKTNHPEALKTLRKPNGEFIFNYESGQLLRQLFSQWKDKHTEVYEAIKQRNEFSAKAIKEGDVEAYVDLFTEDGIYMWPGIPAIEGREALRAWFTKRFAKFAPEIERMIEEIIVSGDWAFERGKEIVKIKNRSTGDVQVIREKYINLLKKQSDGSWKTARRIRNLDHPPLMQ